MALTLATVHLHSPSFPLCRVWVAAPGEKVQPDRIMRGRRAQWARGKERRRKREEDVPTGIVAVSSAFARLVLSGTRERAPVTPNARAISERNKRCPVTYIYIGTRVATGYVIESCQTEYTCSRGTMVCVAEKKEHRDEQTEEYVLVPLYSMSFFFVEMWKSFKVFWIFGLYKYLVIIYKKSIIFQSWFFICRKDYFEYYYFGRYESLKIIIGRNFSSKQFKLG